MIDDRAGDVSAAGLELLIAVRHLKTLHIDRHVSYKDKQDKSGKLATLALDNDDELTVPAGEAEAFLRAVKALRQAKRGIVIDNRSHAPGRRENQIIRSYTDPNAEHLRSLPQLSPGAFPSVIPAGGFNTLKW
jgi:hypothetical protein